MPDLATIRPDGTPQVNPMWFSWDGEHVFFTNTKTRAKYRNVTKNPEVAFSVNDPEQPYPLTSRSAAPSSASNPTPPASSS